MSERELAELLLKWRLLAEKLENDKKFRQIAGDQKGIIAALLLLLVEIQKQKL
ncbi:MAG: hypothetical protein ACTSYD_13375 [Candidatus Heimdallarchaeaceae archaeon]